MMEKVAVYHTSMTDEVTTALAAALQTKTIIETLDTSHCRDVTNAGKEALRKEAGRAGVDLVE
jgi:hypothetical protein